MSTLYKMGGGDGGDGDEGHPSNCFPVRVFPHQRGDGAGHWLVAHRETMERRRRDLRRRNLRTMRTSRPDSAALGPAGAEPAAGSTLDRTFLIGLHRVEKPSDLCSIDVREQRLTSVNDEDLKEFDNIVYINAWDNYLSIESFRSFRLLRELDLSLNGCCDMKFDPEDFPHLEVLDLSFNNVSEGDIVRIGRLAGLKVLHLTGNRLHQLPVNMAGSNHHDSSLPTPPATCDERPWFGALEVLTLEDNRLSSGVFLSLAPLARLRRLNLQGNTISEIPFMTSGGDGAMTNQDNVMGTSQAGVMCEVESSLPLPQLQFLSLAHNKIAEEEALLAAALFPSLTELVIHNNPLTARRVGESSLLTYLLSVRGGVTVKRSDHPEVRRPVVMLPHTRKHKAGNKGKVLKTSHAERPRGPGGGQGLPKKPSSSSQAEEVKGREVKVKVTGDVVGGGGDGTNQSVDSFFATQPGDLCGRGRGGGEEEKEEEGGELEHNTSENAKETENNRRSAAALSEMFADHVALMDASRSAEVAAATGGIQTAVRTLERRLQRLIVCRDVSTETSNPPQQPHTSTGKRAAKKPRPS